MRAFVVNNPEQEKRMDLIMARANTWFKKTSLFSATYMITSPPNEILLNIDATMQLLKRINTTTIRVCNWCGFQWEQDRTDEEMDKLFSDHTEQKKEDIYHSHPHLDWTDWTTFKEDKPSYRKLKVKMLLNMGLEFKTKTTPAAEEAIRNIRRTFRKL